MSSNGDIWAVTPSTSATYYRAAASIAGAGALTLLTDDAGPNGVGYKVRFTSAGNDSGITFTIVGITVADALTCIWPLLFCIRCIVLVWAVLHGTITPGWPKLF